MLKMILEEVRIEMSRPEGYKSQSQEVKASGYRIPQLQGNESLKWIFPSPQELHILSLFSGSQPLTSPPIGLFK